MSLFSMALKGQRRLVGGVKVHCEVMGILVVSILLLSCQAWVQWKIYLHHHLRYVITNLALFMPLGTWGAITLHNNREFYCIQTVIMCRCSNRSRMDTTWILSFSDVFPALMEPMLMWSSSIRVSTGTTSSSFPGLPFFTLLFILLAGRSSAQDCF